MIEYHLFSSPVNELMWPVVINGCYITKAENQILMEVKLEFSGFFFFFFWIRLPVFNKWREQRNILNDTAGYSQQNPDYGQTTGQKTVSSLKKKKKEKKLQGKREIKWEGKHTLKEKGKTYQPIAIQRLFGFCFKHTRKNSKMTGEI